MGKTKFTNNEKIILKAILFSVFLVILVIVCSFIFLLTKQVSFFFHPNFNEEAYNYVKSYGNVEEVKIDSENGDLYGFIKYDNEKNEKKPLVIYFQGNAQSAAVTMYIYEERGIWDYFSGYNILVVDYPEYGKSEGKLSEKTFFAMTESVYDYAKNLDCVDENEIVIMGYSIGTGAATYLASQKDVEKLILLAPYDNALSLYNANFNVFYGPIKLLTALKLESDKYAENVQEKTLIFTSYNDEVINYKFSENLSTNFKNLDEFIILNENVSHNDYLSTEAVLERIKSFLN